MFSNFIYFISAIFIFLAAPRIPTQIFFPIQDGIGIGILIISYFYLTRSHFYRLKGDLDSGIFTIEEARSNFNSIQSMNLVIAIIFFALEIFIFDLKAYILKIKWLGNSETFIYAAGVLIFLFHLAINWFWGYRSLGKALNIAPSLFKHIFSHIKFNVAVISPLLLLLMIFDGLNALNLSCLDEAVNQTYFQLGFLVLYSFILTIIAPMLVTFLWDCNQFSDDHLKNRILSFCQEQKVKFRKILFWNALNKGLATAGVIGVFPLFRYLLITPRLSGILNEEEMMAVVSHEVGHVKKKHMQIYLLFFMVFLISSSTLINKILQSFREYIHLHFQTTNGGENLWMNIIEVVIFFMVFILYFRFVFGYYMRNFERQADLYCFSSGINPDHLISSFKKLGVEVGDDGKKSNWHHYNLTQRIEFLKRCVENPQLIQQHDRHIRKSLLIFFSGFALIIILFATPLLQYLDRLSILQKEETHLQELLNQYPDEPYQNQQLSDNLNEQGGIYMNRREYNKALLKFQESVSHEKDQPQTYYWMAIISSLRSAGTFNPKQAIEYAKQAVKYQETPEFLEILADTYLADNQIKEAYRVSQKALEITKGKNQYFLDKYKAIQCRYQESQKQIIN